MLKALLLFFISLNVSSMSFDKAVGVLGSHLSVETLRAYSEAELAMSGARGSWGDPMLMASVMDLPMNSLNKNESAMTGLGVGLSQKFSLTNKYSNIEDASVSMAQSYRYDADDLQRGLVASFWKMLILNRKLQETKAILKENLIWISNILKVSKKLYVNGKISQQAILEIQIRKTEIEVKLNDNEYEIQKVKDNFKFLLGDNFDSIDESTIPWSKLNIEGAENKDFRALSLKSKLKAKDFALSAANKSYIPDLTVSLGYTKMPNTPGSGDYIGASVSFPLPFSGEKYSRKDSAVHEKYSAQRKYENYKRKKKLEASILEREIEKTERDLLIITSKTLKFAKNSREITSKSYGNGRSSYLELLQTELKLQEILVLKSELLQKRDTNKVALKYTRGESLSE